MVKYIFFSTVFMVLLMTTLQVYALDIPVSDATTECMDCHSSIHPGIVQSWQNSRHAKTTPKKASAIKGLKRKISSDTIPENFSDFSVGCAECHTQRSETHADTFEHNGYDIHIVVSPQDCATCHSEEVKQYGKNLMSNAYGNLADNAVYGLLEESIIGKAKIEEIHISFSPTDADTRAESCYYCHGTKLAVTGSKVRDTDLAGELEFPVISGWPNQGVGRINLDGSKGNCSACHTRHSFSIEMARKPHTCSECHIGPDVPAYKIYSVSKHGNIFSTIGDQWNFNAVPWVVGEDFTSPTCAACHMSLIVNTDGELVSERTHQMNDRIPWRIFGLIYAHPHVKEANTTTIRNKSGLSLPTDFDGSFASDFLIKSGEMEKRKKTMQAVCLNCHGTSWVTSFWRRFENTIDKTNEEILNITKVMRDIWKQGFATGPEQKGNPFDEAIEKKWSESWLFYANTIRFSSAMAGGGDYSVFANGRYHQSQNLTDLYEWLMLREDINGGKKREKQIK